MSNKTKRILRYLSFLPASIATGIIVPFLFILVAAWAGSPMVSGWTLEYLILLPSTVMAGMVGGYLSIAIGIKVAPEKSILVLVLLGASTAVFSADKIFINWTLMATSAVHAQSIALFLGNILYLITALAVLIFAYLNPDEDLLT